jgi:hypothetical protein
MLMNVTPPTIEACADLEAKPSLGELAQPVFESVSDAILIFDATRMRILFANPAAISLYGYSDAVLQHHERLDGSGYSNGLRGDAICAEARILAVADVVDAMASHRPYRAALGIEKALAEIETRAGVLFDPAVVASCVRLFREKGYSFDLSGADRPRRQHPTNSRL